MHACCRRCALRWGGGFEIVDAVCVIVAVTLSLTFLDLASSSSSSSSSCRSSAWQGLHLPPRQHVCGQRV